MELRTWISDHALASLEADGPVNEEQILREVAGAIERFTLERYGVMLSVDLD